MYNSREREIENIMEFEENPFIFEGGVVSGQVGMSNRSTKSFIHLVGLKKKEARDD